MWWTGFGKLGPENGKTRKQKIKRIIGLSS